MSLRDFGPSEERTVTLNHEPLSHEAGGNGSGLGEFHTVHPEEIEPNNTGKIIGALAVALMVGAAGVYAYTMTGHSANTVPLQQTAGLPKPMPAPPPATPAPEMAAPVAEPVAAPVTEPAAVERPVKSAAAKTAAPISDGASVRMNADSQSTAASQQAAATPIAPAQQAAIPEPVSPAPSPSDLANANPQSGVSVPPGAATAQDIPAQPVTPEQPAQPEAAAPAQAQPEQAAGQVAQ